MNRSTYNVKGLKNIAKWKIWLGVAILLYIFSFLSSHYLSYDANPARLKYTLENSLRTKERVFYQLMSDKKKVLQLIAEDNSSENADIEYIEKLPIGIFVYKVNDLGNPLLIFWNNTHVENNESLLKQKDGSFPVSNSKGFFEQINYTVKQGQDIYKIVGIIPIYWQYPQSSTLLKNKFDGYPELSQRYKISNTGIAISNGDNKVLYHLERTEGDGFSKLDTTSLLLKVIALLIMAILFNDYMKIIVVKHGFYVGFLCFLAVVVGVRLASYYFPFPFNFRVYEFFDPLIFATSWLHRSLGDLIINLLLLWWITTFIKNNFASVKRAKLTIVLKRYKHLFAVLGLITLPIVSVQFVRILESLVTDSQISFNVTSFFAMNRYTVVCFAALGIFMWCYVRICYICILPVRLVRYSYWKRTIIILLVGLVIGMFFSSGSTILMDYMSIIWVALFSIFYDLNWPNFRKDFVASPVFLSIVLILSLSLAGVIFTENKILELKDRKFFAENLGMRSDETGEMLLHTAISNFNGYFIQNGVKPLYNETQNSAIKYKITNDYFSGYLNRYHTRIYTFDSLKQPLFNSDSTHFETLQNNIQMMGKRMDIPDLYYNESRPEEFSYIYRKKILNIKDSLIAYAFILVKPLRYSDNQLDVRLFNTSKSLPGDINNDYSYAIYYNNKLMTSYLDGGYSSSIQPKDFHENAYLQQTLGNKSLLWYKVNDKKTILVVKQNNVLLEFITLFAYIFCSAIIILCLAYVCIYFVFSGFNLRYLRSITRLTINRKMQATIIFLSFFSFLVVSISTITFFLAQFKESNKLKLSRSANIISKETENSIKNDLLQDIDEIDFANENILLDAFSKKVLQIANLNNLDINYYSLNGNLVASTQPIIYGNGIFSSLMNPYAFYMLRNRNKLEFTNEESIGDFKFSSIYFPLVDQQGNNIAYLNIPYLNSQNEVRQQISSFLVTIINLNALIFLFAGFMALRLTKQITEAFGVIEGKMRFLNLTGKNEPINYKRRDEIGALVAGYNRMLKKLSESVEALSKSEREGAWQEMARQVAHEIKNPLTPMKLSIQYLDKSIASGSTNAIELSKKVTKTLIEQIDQLAKIAGDFSQFANISNTVPINMDLRDCLKSIVTLYNADDTIQITLEMPNEATIIYADKMQMNRLFTNLIKNAIEASALNDRKIITIKQTIVENYTIVAVTDKGTGISEEMKNKIFVPNFTTKSSGTGLGLAICKGICERASGTIYFDSVLGEGTTFYIRLPLKESAHEN